MARTLYTVDNLIAEVRSQLDESNTDSVDTDRDILPALNRAQEYAFDIYARKYPDPLLTYTTLTLTGGTTEYTIPDSVFEDRIVKLEIIIPGTTGSGNEYQDVKRISYVDVSDFEGTGRVSIPQYFTVYGRTIRFIGTPTGAYNARLWSLAEPNRLVVSQGRITALDSGTPTVTVDALTGDLTTNTNNLASYINIIDGQTGEVKGSMQIGSINTTSKLITLRTSPIRSTVLGRTIDTTLDADIAEDDYICLIQGTCVPYYGTPTSNFLIQYAVAEITRKLGGEAGLEKQVLDDLEKQLTQTDSNRNFPKRIHKRNPVWGTIRIRRFPRATN